MTAVLLCLSQLTWLTDRCTGVYSVGLLSKLQGCMRGKSERKVRISDISSLNIELAVAQAGKEGVLKGKEIVGHKSNLLVLWFTPPPPPPQVSVFLSRQQYIQLSHVNAYLSWISRPA